MSRTALRWRLTAITAESWGGTPRVTIDADDGVAAIDTLTLSPLGDSLDGQLTADPSAADLRPRDAVTFETHDLTTDTWVPRWAGIVTTAGNPRATSPQTYRLAGIRQRMYEKIVQLTYVPEGDVGEMVRAVLAASTTLPAGITYDAADVPDLGFTMGGRAGAFETAGDFLDAMTATVGPFVVPPGETYAYDGRTYAAGEVVPPAEWGVRPDGAIYFRRTKPGNPGPLIFSPTDARTNVEWAPINAEDATGTPLLVYAGQINTQDAAITEATYRNPGGSTVRAKSALPLHPIARLNGRTPLDGNNPPVASTVYLDGPADFMAKTPGLTAPSTTGVTNPGNAIDGDPATFATCTGGPAPMHLLITKASAQRDGAWRVTYATSVESSLPLMCRLQYVEVLPSTGGMSISYVLPHTGGEIKTIWLPFPMFAEYTGSRATLEPRLTISSNSNTAGLILVANIYEVEYWQPDCDLTTPVDASKSARYADALKRNPASLEVARITYDGLPDLNRAAKILQPSPAPAVKVDIERATLALTVDGGVRTTYYAGQAWPATVKEQQVMLARLARRAVAEGGRRR